MESRKQRKREANLETSVGTMIPCLISDLRSYAKILLLEGGSSATGVGEAIALVDILRGRGRHKEPCQQDTFRQVDLTEVEPDEK
jgi:hypothetical protein